ncbi:hypothetical protein TIFTF001_055630 [Ficus carica]|uniref:Uncharacterized protein n=1 Tax=Ficus carica TaxID=3494 RepID=A0AA88ELR6_FICCA|nr:hypothetical protein TIFTF001_055630 [Ficus carica]
MVGDGEERERESVWATKGEREAVDGLGEARRERSRGWLGRRRGERERGRGRDRRREREESLLGLGKERERRN